MSRFAFTSDISEHIKEDNIGQLILLDVVIAREGDQDYYESEVYESRKGSTKIITVKRPREVVYTSAPTFEGKPFIAIHTEDGVDINIDKFDNMKDHHSGHVQNVRPGIENDLGVLIADIVVNKKDTKEKIKSGEYREVSCGYFFEIDEKTNTLTSIAGEHVALVKKGRAGISKIKDKEGIEPMEKLKNVVESLRSEIKKLKDSIRDEKKKALDEEEVAWINGKVNELEVGNVYSLPRSKSARLVTKIEESNFSDKLVIVWEYAFDNFENSTEHIHETYEDKDIDILIDIKTKKKIKL